MTTQTEALNVALDALRNSQDYKMGRAITVEAVELIEESLAQPEQEPENRCVRELREFAKSNQGAYIFPSWDGHRVLKYLGDTTPPQRKPLTDEMIVAGGKALAKLHAESCGLDFDDVWKYYAEDHKADAKAAIEAAHGIKENT